LFLSFYYAPVYFFKKFFWEKITTNFNFRLQSSVNLVATESGSSKNVKNIQQKDFQAKYVLNLVKK
ncbi:MAG: hypothetical protein PHC34_13810, partial [Candidatus Gastranaerophilales bacterium]|nr:hypothetical protein [Candidatus Gastranaerophilales bacterium]